MSNEPRYIWAFISPPSDSCHIYSRMQPGILRLAVTICCWLFSCLDNKWVVFSGQWIAHWRKKSTSVKEIKNKKWTRLWFSPPLLFSLQVLFRGSTANRGKSAWEDMDDEHQLLKVVSTPIIALSWSYLFWSLVPLLKVALRETRWQVRGE